MEAALADVIPQEGSLQVCTHWLPPWPPLIQAAGPLPTHSKAPPHSGLVSVPSFSPDTVMHASPLWHTDTGVHLLVWVRHLFIQSSWQPRTITVARRPVWYIKSIQRLWINSWFMSILKGETIFRTGSFRVWRCTSMVEHSPSMREEPQLNSQPYT